MFRELIQVLLDLFNKALEIFLQTVPVLIQLSDWAPLSQSQSEIPIVRFKMRQSFIMTYPQKTSLV